LSIEDVLYVKPPAAYGIGGYHRRSDSSDYDAEIEILYGSNERLTRERAGHQVKNQERENANASGHVGIPGRAPRVEDSSKIAESMSPVRRPESPSVDVSSSP
jgi:hypothetical protein